VRSALQRIRIGAERTFDFVRFHQETPMGKRGDTEFSKLAP